MSKWLLTAFLFFGGRLQAEPTPWLTGPLIAPLGTAVPYGDVLIKSYVSFSVDTGAYDSRWRALSADENFYSLRANFLCFFGLTPWCDLNIAPTFSFNTASNQHSFDPGDLTVGLDFQLLSPTYTPYFPGIKLALREVFPTGHFQYFRPNKLRADQTGAGTFATQFDLVFYKVFPLFSHFLSTTLSAEYTLNTPAAVHGFNTYGGGFGTRGVALPGNRFQGIFSFELTLTQNWVLALDTVYTHTDATQFYGLPGISFTGTYATTGAPSVEQLSFAPALEYNWGPHFGLIAGCWLSALGRNAPVFRNALLNFNYIY